MKVVYVHSVEPRWYGVGMCRELDEIDFDECNKKNRSFNIS